MALAVVKLYIAGPFYAWSKAINLMDGNVKLALLKDTYTPNRESHLHWSDVSAHEVSNQQGYDAGGKALSASTFAYVADQNAAAWLAETSYRVGDVVRPTAANGHVYICCDAGISGQAVPTWATDGRETVADGTCLWAEYGIGYLKFIADSVVWADSGIEARWGVIYYSTGSALSSSLIALVDWSTNLRSDDADFQVDWSPFGIFTLAVSFE